MIQITLLDETTKKTRFKQVNKNLLNVAKFDSETSNNLLSSEPKQHTLL